MIKKYLPSVHDRGKIIVYIYIYIQPAVFHRYFPEPFPPNVTSHQCELARAISVSWHEPSMWAGTSEPSVRTGTSHQWALAWAISARWHEPSVHAGTSHQCTLARAISERWHEPSVCAATSEPSVRNGTSHRCTLARAISACWHEPSVSAGTAIPSVADRYHSLNPCNCHDFPGNENPSNLHTLEAGNSPHARGGQLSTR